MQKAYPIIDLDVDFRFNGERGKITLERGTEVPVLTLLRDSHGTMDFTTVDGGDEIECQRVPKRFLQLF